MARMAVLLCFYPIILSMMSPNEKLSHLARRLKAKIAEYSRLCRDFELNRKPELDSANEMRLYKIEQIREILQWIKELK